MKLVTIFRAHVLRDVNAAIQLKKFNLAKEIIRAQNLKLDQDIVNVTRQQNNLLERPITSENNTRLNQHLSKISLLQNQKNLNARMGKNIDLLSFKHMLEKQAEKALTKHGVHLPVNMLERTPGFKGFLEDSHIDIEHKSMDLKAVITRINLIHDDVINSTQTSTATLRENLDSLLEARSLAMYAKYSSNHHIIPYVSCSINERVSLIHEHTTPLKTNLDQLSLLVQKLENEYTAGHLTVAELRTIFTNLNSQIKSTSAHFPGLMDSVSSIKEDYLLADVSRILGIVGES